jgi:hypothetical protein
MSRPARRSRRSRRAGESPMSFFSFQDVITSVTGILVLVTLLLTLELVTREELTAAVVPEASAGGAPDVPVAQRLADAQAELAALRQEVEALDAALGEAAASSPLAGGVDVAAVGRDVGELERANAKTRAQLAAAERAVSALRDDVAREHARTREAAAQSDEAARRLDRLRRSPGLILLPGADDEKRPLFVECAAGGLTVGSPDESGRLQSIVRMDGGVAAVDDLLAWAAARDAAAECFVVMVRPDAVGTSRPVINRLREAGFDVGWEPLPAGAPLFGTDPR